MFQVGMGIVKNLIPLNDYGSLRVPSMLSFILLMKRYLGEKDMNEIIMFTYTF